MSLKGRMLITLALGLALVCPEASFANKTTELMSGALKQRSNGNLQAAIKGFKEAVDSAPSILQRNLALFMLGDCQLETGKHSDAVKTFSELSVKGTTADERAEALYKLMEANSGLNKTEEVSNAFNTLKNKYSNTAYFEVAKAFMNVGESVPKANTSSSTSPEKISLPKKSSEAKPTETKPSAAKATVAKPAVGNTKPSVSKASSKSVKATAPSKGLDAATQKILEEVLYRENISETQRDQMVTKILSYQDKLKDGEKGAGKDKVLYDLAQATASFGELLEACKTYDKILSLHPTSPLVEDAYYQSIRLRAMLGVHQTVVEWSRAFNITFPESKYKKQIAALVKYSQAGGKIKIEPKAPSASKAVAKTSSKVASKSSGKADKETANTGFGLSGEAANGALKASALYKTATNKMNEGKYSSALEDLKILTSKFGESSQLWWDITLVYVQLEDFREADKSIRKMLLLDPDNSDANSLLGYIQYRLENYEEAANAYENAGEAEGEGVTFFDAKSASERMKKSAK